MSAGTLTLTCLMLCLGQSGQDTFYSSDRHFKIPINIEPAQRQAMQGMVLYISKDKGAIWQQEQFIAAKDEGFIVHVQADGEYWYRIAVVDKKGQQDPANIEKAGETHKIIVDTLRPDVRILLAQRQGDEVLIRWEIQESHPDTKSLKLRYRPAAAETAPWSDPAPIPVVPIGETRVKVNTGGALTFRLEIKDRAGNFNYAEATVPGDVAQTNFTGNSQVPFNPPTPPEFGNVPPPKPPAAVPPVAPPKTTEVVQAPFSANSGDNQTAWESTGSGPKFATADSDKGPPPNFGPPPGGTPYQVGSAPSAPSNPIAPAPVPPPSRPLPPVQIVNNTKVVLQYELSHVGPAGIGGIELWMTRNDGLTWEPYKKDELVKASMQDNKYMRTLELPGQGVFGLTLVVYNQNKRGKKPVAGDVPQMRIEVDLTPPEAALWPPEPDPQVRDAVVIAWEAKDKNLSEGPVTLEWAEQRIGPWHLIQTSLPNTGKYSWAVPVGVPPNVYMRLRVRDKAGNEGIAATDRPQSIDVSEPEGRLVGVGLLSAVTN